MPDQGSIVLIPIPFTDLYSGRYSFMVTSSDLEEGRLNRPGTVRVDKIYTLSQALVVKIFGRVNAATLDRIRALLQELTAKKG